MNTNRKILALRLLQAGTPVCGVVGFALTLHIWKSPLLSLLPMIIVGIISGLLYRRLVLKP